MVGPFPGQPRARPSPVRCLIITILVLLILFALVILIIWLIIRPAPIDYSVEKAQIRDFNISSSNALKATFDLTLQTNNRNKKISIYYDSIEVTVFYDGQLVALTDLQPFHQPKHNVTTMEVSAAAAWVPLKGDVVRTMKKERSKGVAKLEVRVEARVRFKVGAVKSRHYRLRADCEGVVVKLWSSEFNRVDCDVDV